MVPSVKEEVDPLSEAKSQVWFIETFAKPLFDLTASGIPGQFTILSHTDPFRLTFPGLQRPRNTRRTATRTSLRGKQEPYRFPRVILPQVPSRILTASHFTNVNTPFPHPRLLRILFPRSPWLSLRPSDSGSIKATDHLSTIGPRFLYHLLMF